MMRRCHSSTISGLLCLSFCIAFLLFTKHVKQRFEDMQKLQRLQNYLGELNLMSDSLEQLEMDESQLALDVGSLKELFQMTSNFASDESSMILEKPFQENATITYS